MKKAVEERVRAEKALEDTEKKDREVEATSLGMWAHLAHNNFGPRFTEVMRERRRR